MKNNKKLLMICIAAAVVLVGVMLLLIFLPKGGEGGSNGEATVDEGAKVEIVTDSNGVLQAQIATKPNGEIDVADIEKSYGKLMEHVPADIIRVHVENDHGTLDVAAHTPEGEATEYKLLGYEGFDLQAGIPDEIANAASSISFTKIASQHPDNIKEYGLDKPRSVVEVTYTDNTTSRIYVGDDAPQGVGTYVRFGSGEEVYLVPTDAVAPFDYDVTKLISLAVNDSATDVEKGQASSIRIKGEAIDGELELVPNKGGKASASYILAKPSGGYANESESSLIEGAIRGLYADSVVYVKPSEDQLEKVGLLKPHTELEADYPDLKVSLVSSKPSGGKVYFMEKDGDVVYEISSDKLPWAETSYEKLVSEYVLNAKLDALSALSVSVDGKTYDFELESHDETTTDDEGNESTTTVTTVKYDGKEIETDKFTEFYNELAKIERADIESGDTSGSAAISAKFTYYSDGESDSVGYYKSDSSRYAVELNGDKAGHAYGAGVVRAIEALKGLVN